MPNKNHASGRFTSGPTGIKTEVKFDTPKLNPEFEKPLVSLSVTNPLKKILYWLDSIRKKQTTTFMIKLSIPLIALPLIALAFFQLGRNFPYFISSISPTTQTSPTPPTPTPNPEQPISKTGTVKLAKGTPPKYLLSIPDGSVILLKSDPETNLENFKNQQVFIYGVFNIQTNTLTIEDISEIESLPTSTPTIIPTPTD